MVNLVIPSVVIILIMFIMAFLIFKNIVKRLDVNTKKYFIEKMQEYEYLITEKKNELESLKTKAQEYENTISASKETLSYIEEKSKDNSSSSNSSSIFTPYDGDKLEGKLEDRNSSNNKHVNNIEDIESLSANNKEGIEENKDKSKNNNIGDKDNGSNNSLSGDLKDYSNMQVNIVSKNSSKKKGINKSSELLNYIRVPEYKEDTFFYNYKRLKKDFYFDNETLIRKFIDTQVDSKDDNKYDMLLKLIRTFDNKTIYELITLSNENQKKLVSDILSQEEKDLINFDNKFKDNKKFNSIEFLNYLKEQIKLFDPKVYVYVSKSDKSYDYIGNNVKTMYYTNMSEGVIIKYKNKIYDYSI